MVAPGSTRVTFPPAAWVAMALGVAAMVVLLVVQLTAIESQRRIVRDQDRKIATLTRAALPLLRETRPLVRDARPVLGAVNAALPPLGRALRRTDPLQTLTSVNDLTTALSEQDRLLRLIDAGLVTLAEVADRDLLARADRALRLTPLALGRLRRTVVLQRDLLRVQRGTSQLQSQSLAVQREQLSVARASLRHVESLDRKTGGPAPPRR
jgi:hypothetical protein